MFRLKLRMTSGMFSVILCGVVGVCLYVRGDAESCRMRRRRAGPVVSLMSELDEEKVNLSASLHL